MVVNAAESARIGWGRTVVNIVVRDILTEIEIVIFEYRPESGEEVTYLDTGGRGIRKSPKERRSLKSKNPMLGIPYR